MSSSTYTPFDLVTNVMRAAVTVMEYIAPDSMTTLNSGERAVEFRNRLLSLLTFQIRYARRPVDANQRYTMRVYQCEDLTGGHEIRGECHGVISCNPQANLLAEYCSSMR